MFSLRAFPTPKIFFLLVCLLPTHSVARMSSDTEGLLKKMQAAYDMVEDYQVSMAIRTHESYDSFKIKKFLYTFKKPNWIRIDFESPDSGMALVYPDRNGKVVVRPFGWARFFKLHLAPDSSLLEVSSGQRIDQTDMGLLIRNITHSLTDQRRGRAEFKEDERQIRIRVLADNHFQDGVVTLYEFFIDKKQWLPVGVEESTPDGILERKIIFQNLRVNVGIPDSFFQLDGG